MRFVPVVSGVIMSYACCLSDTFHGMLGVLKTLAPFSADISSKLHRPYCGSEECIGAQVAFTVLSFAYAIQCHLGQQAATKYKLTAKGNRDSLQQCVELAMCPDP